MVALSLLIHTMFGSVGFHAPRAIEELGGKHV